jgi:hypothetical protein
VDRTEKILSPHHRLIQVASLASRHEQITVRAAFFFAVTALFGNRLFTIIRAGFPITLAGFIIRSMKRLLGCVVLGLVTMAASAQWTNPSDDVPAYNAKAPSKPLPPLLSGNQLTGIYFSHPYQVTAYKMAAKIPEVLHQQPCYCHCDRAMGHNSLHSCFEGTHGAACSTCMKEAIYAYQQTKKGQTPSQIRAGIERGEWQYVDLETAA